jgi:hypothetical protein
LLYPFQEQEALSGRGQEKANSTHYLRVFVIEPDKYMLEIRRQVAEEKIGFQTGDFFGDRS